MPGGMAAKSCTQHHGNRRGHENFRTIGWVSVQPAPAGQRGNDRESSRIHRTVRAAMSARLSSAVWLTLYVVAVTAPLFVLLLGPVPPAGGFWWDFAMALGFAALAMMGVQFVLTARFRRATMPFGIDIVYYFHRYLAVFALAIAGAHYLILRVDSPVVLGTANPFDAPAHMTAGRAAITLFVLLAATAAFVLALWHVMGTGYYVDTPWKEALWTGYGLFWIAIIGYVRIVKPWSLLRAPFRVAEVRRERGDASTLVLHPERRNGMRFQPGQFAWLTLRASPFALREHPFSIASSAARAGSIELTIKAVGDFTRAAVDALPGEKAFLDGPYGAFSIDRYPQAPGYAFMAGGVGIAPIMSMLRTLADRGDRRPLTLLYGNRRWERVLFREELVALAGRLDLRLVHVLKEPPEDWLGDRGQFTRELLEKRLPREQSGLHYFICGPTAMTQCIERWLKSIDVASTQVHSEIFEWV